MVDVVVFVNELTSTSIPVEIAAETHRITDAEICLVSHYDSSEDTLDPDIEDLTLPAVRLGATSRTDVTAYQQLRCLCNKETVDVLHTHHNSTGSLARFAVAGTDTTIVNTEHNDHQFFSHAQKIVNSVSYPLIDVNVSNSHNTRNSFEWYEQTLFTNTQQEIVYNGIDLSKIDDATECPIDLPDGPTIVVVGSLIEQKNHETLLRAFGSVSDVVPESSLVIVGEGPLSEVLERLANDLGIADSVLFTGYLPRRDDVYAVLKRSTIGAFPSWYEGFCVAAVEAMAAGLPVVVSDIDVFHEVVGKSGMFVDPDEPVEIADALTDLLQHPQKRYDLGRQAKSRARSRFPLERTAREYYNIYKEVAETPNG